MTMIQEGVVSLVFYKPEFKSIFEEYSLPEEQLKFTGLPMEAIQFCEEEEDRYPIVILFENVPAGFFVLHGWEGVKAYSHNRNAILLRAYSVNPAFQGKGIASKSLLLLPSFVKKHFPGKNEIILGVNHRNIKAQHVYKKGGFIDKGIRVIGKKGELHILHMEL